jgi:glutamyl aminopeptidase
MGSKLTKKQIELFSKITQFYAPSGFEYPVAHYLYGLFESKQLKVVNDNLGSIFGLIKSKNPHPFKVLICAHMDEVGFMVTTINKNGTIQCTPLGGHNIMGLGAQRAVLISKNGDYINGSINLLPPHLKNAGSDMDIKDLLFDFGLKNSKDAIANGAYIGAPIVLRGDFEILKNKERLLSKAFDDRYGIVLIADVLDELLQKDYPFDLYVGGTVQEEVGLRGAQTASSLIKPDLAIVLDCSPSKDVLLSEETGSIGNGVLIRYFDRSMIAFPKLISFQIEACKNCKVPYQYFQSPGSTDAGVIHKNNDGILTLTHCICARSIHSTSSIIDINDYLAARKSLLYMLEHLNKESLKAFKE